MTDFMDSLLCSMVNTFNSECSTNGADCDLNDDKTAKHRKCPKYWNAIKDKNNVKLGSQQQQLNVHDDKIKLENNSNENVFIITEIKTEKLEEFIDNDGESGREAKSLIQTKESSNDKITFNASSSASLTNSISGTNKQIDINEINGIYSDIVVKTEKEEPKSEFLSDDDAVHDDKVINSNFSTNIQIKKIKTNAEREEYRMKKRAEWQRRRQGVQETDEEKRARKRNQDRIRAKNYRDRLKLKKQLAKLESALSTAEHSLPKVLVKKNKKKNNHQHDTNCKELTRSQFQIQEIIKIESEEVISPSFPTFEDPHEEYDECSKANVLLHHAVDTNHLQDSLLVKIETKNNHQQDTNCEESSLSQFQIQQSIKTEAKPGICPSFPTFEAPYEENGECSTESLLLHHFMDIDYEVQSKKIPKTTAESPEQLQPNPEEKVQKNETSETDRIRKLNAARARENMKLKKQCAEFDSVPSSSNEDSLPRVIVKNRKKTNKRNDAKGDEVILGT